MASERTEYLIDQALGERLERFVVQREKIAGLVAKGVLAASHLERVDQLMEFLSPRPMAGLPEAPQVPEAVPGALTQTWSHLNGLIEKTREELPDSPALDFCRALADKIPYHTPVEKQEQARQAISSSDPDTASIGREVLILFSLRTILNALEPFLPHSEEGDNEVMQAAFESAMGRFNRLVSRVPIHIQVHQAVTHGVARWIAREKRVPVRWVIDGKDRVVVPAVDEIFSQHPYGLNKNEIDAFAQAISSQTGIGKKSVSSYLRRRNSLIGGQKPTGGIEETEDQWMKESLGLDIQRVLGTLTDNRAKDVINSRFGLEDDREKTLEEVGTTFGVTRERIRQIEAKALRQLRHPARSNRFRDYR